MRCLETRGRALTMKGQTNQTILRPKLQRRLRSSMTDAELRLWRCLRRRQMSGFKFRRQHPFGDYIIDFVCLEAMLAIEADGSQHDMQQSKDSVRTEYLKRARFRVLRFWNSEVMSDIDSIAQVIWRELQMVGPATIPAFSTHPHLNPPPAPVRGSPTKGEEGSSPRLPLLGKERKREGPGWG